MGRRHLPPSLLHTVPGHLAVQPYEYMQDLPADTPIHLAPASFNLAGSGSGRSVALAA